MLRVVSRVLHHVAPVSCLCVDTFEELMPQPLRLGAARCRSALSALRSAALRQLLRCCALGLATSWPGGIQICPDPKSCGMAVRALSENDKEEIKPVDFFLFDITGGVFEYQITEPMGPNTTHSKARSALAGGAAAVAVVCLGVLPNGFAKCCRSCSGPLAGARLRSLMLTLCYTGWVLKLQRHAASVHPQARQRSVTAASAQVLHEVVDGACPQSKDFNIVRCSGCALQ